VFHVSTRLCYMLLWCYTGGHGLGEQPPVNWYQCLKFAFFFANMTGQKLDLWLRWRLNYLIQMDCWYNWFLETSCDPETIHRSMYQLICWFFFYHSWPILSYKTWYITLENRLYNTVLIVYTMKKTRLMPSMKNLSRYIFVIIHNYWIL